MEEEEELDIVAAKKRAEIDEEIGEEPGHPGYMGKYVTALNEIVNGLTDEEKKEYMELANK
jgi:hypothetical protein